MGRGGGAASVLHVRFTCSLVEFTSSRLGATSLSTFKRLKKALHVKCVW